mmetsp:Transcript_14077/g.28621  ORF Transcript_14077/g.28621 Transcript_14077/m.28621 type:complete len:87 (-) Transcript_14077:1520-1780(-)
MESSFKFEICVIILANSASDRDRISIMSTASSIAREKTKISDETIFPTAMSCANAQSTNTEKTKFRWIKEKNPFVRDVKWLTAIFI